MKPHRNRPVTLEDLLRLKRSERPPAAFWSQFDRELRAKQLSALVAKRPWWQTLPAVSFRALYRFRLPLGAAAVCSLTFLAMRDSHLPTGAMPGGVQKSQAVASETARGDLRSTARQSAVASVADLPNAEVSIDLPANANVANAVSAQPAMVAVFEPTVADTAPIAPHAAVTESTGARLPVSFVTTTSAPSTGSRLLGGRTGFESRGLPARATVEPLAQMTSPGESRRARLLTAMVSTASLETSVRTTERAASRIAEERLYDQVQRFGARGDRLNVKF